MARERGYSTGRYWVAFISPFALSFLITLGLVVSLGLIGSSTSTATPYLPPPTESWTPTTSAPPSASNTAGSAGSLPTARATPLATTVDCAYPVTAGREAAKPNTPPSTTGVSAEGTVDVTMATSQGDIGLTLNKALSPCTVNSFLNLAKQSYFDNTPCHRLVTSGIYVLQCGDPTGKGTGGPGYGFANEFPTDQYAAGDAAAKQPANYPRGTIAMANSGAANSNGSQFFLLYQDSPLPPQYTVFGTIDAPGLAVIDKVAAGGDDGSMSAGGGAPKIPVTITSMKAKA
jgi:peptidyl-prolyl cis-trans isomerase B (cyclophilin B)